MKSSKSGRAVLSLFHRHQGIVIALMTWFALVHPVLATEGDVHYATDVLPILAERCFRCHGPDEGTREAGLRLDQSASATSVADSGATPIVPGDAGASEVVARLLSDDPDVRMPPDASGEPLSAEQIAVLRRWINEGARYETHWSFQPIQPRLPPNVSVPTRHPIDRWIREALFARGLSPSPRAERYQLIRRVTMDLTGLPPSLPEVEAFVADPRADAYERLVDRLLASPAFGERWARVWLDLARYADSAGYAQDPPRVIWRYRDWVIDRFNDNLSFDEFTIQQLAGDLLADPADHQLLATAFHRNTMTNSEGGTDDEEFRSAAIVDRVNTTFQVWMGLTMGCAQCHSHKYDPISQRDYYRAYAIFNNTADADRGDESPLLVEYSPDEIRRRDKLTAQRAQIVETRQQLERRMRGTDEDATSEDEDKAQGEIKTQLDQLQARLEEIKKQLQEVNGISTPILRELTEERRSTFIHVRGNFRSRGAPVVAGVPEHFSTFATDRDADAPLNRLDLARWLVHPDNPLTARVTVNRLWEQLFGIGLVETSEDFGTQGQRPTHPELLDHLAWTLMRSSWDMKAMLRYLVTSDTYCQSSAVTPRQQQLDPRNRWLSRGPTHRYSGEMLRDQSLAIAGLLSRKVRGPSVRPPRPKLGLRAAFGASTDWETSRGEDRYRRGLYTRWRRTTPYPSLTTFDAPSREVCTIRRLRTNTPLQAFVTLNDPAYVEAAQGLARRMLLEANGSEREQIQFGFRLCVARPADSEELDRLQRLYQEAIGHFRDRPESAQKMTQVSFGPPPSPQDTPQLAALTAVANVLLNLDEVISKK